MAGQEPLGREYLLHEEIGRGASAVVRRVTSRHGGPPLVAKLLYPEPAVQRLFLRDAAALRDLVHPSVVALRDLVVEPGTLALVTDYVDGTDLRRLRSYRSGGLSPAEVAAIVAQAASALAAAHERGVVHLDLRPENILVAARSAPPLVRITDLGVAALLNEAAGRPVAGTPGWTAPEVLAGGPAAPPADVWSLGVLLVDLLTGDPQRDPAALPMPLSAVARDCLADDPRRRPPARRVAAYLHQLAATPGGITAATAPAAAAAAATAPAPAPAIDSPAPGGLSAAASAFTAAAGARPPARPGLFPPAEPADFPAGVAPPPIFMPPQAPAGPVPPIAPADRPERTRGRWRRGPLLTLAAAVLVSAVLAGISMNASAGEQTVQTAQQTTTAPEATTPTEATTPPETAPPTTTPAAPPPTTRLAAPPPATTEARETLRVTLAGTVANGGGTLALSIRDGKAIAYVCDGDRVESWLQGTARAGKLDLEGRDGSTLTGTFDARSAQGRITVAKRTDTFELSVVRKPSGLYRTAARVRGAQLAGGWIVLPDGRQVGVLKRDGVAAPAPELDVANRTATVDGETVTATTVDGETGEGF